MTPERISRARLVCASRFPFFATLLFHVQVLPWEQDGFICNDRSIRIAEKLIQQLPTNRLIGYLAHGVLHIILGHRARRRQRDALMWNMACDIVVNNILLDFSIDLPQGSFYRAGFEGLSAEEVYNLLSQLLADAEDDAERGTRSTTVIAQRVDTYLANEKPSIRARSIARPLDFIYADLAPRDSAERNVPQEPETDDNGADGNELRDRWLLALDAFDIEQTHSGIGAISALLEREISIYQHGEIDWRKRLQKFISRTTADFNMLESRLFTAGIYSETLGSDQLSVQVLIDTSASIGRNELSRFVAELRSLSRLFHFIEIELYYCDSELDGPYELGYADDIPPPRGGGGTDFNAFFERVVERSDFNGIGPVALIFTDGFVAIPSSQPFENVMWILTARGTATSNITWGEVVRLSLESGVE